MIIRYLSPAEVAVIKFGGVTKLARAIGLSPSRVCQWQRGTRNGTGLIPAKFHRKIYLTAKKMNINLTAEEMILGGAVRG